MKNREIKPDLQDVFIKALNNTLPESINQFIHDYKKNKEIIINLVITLKYWANPHGNYKNFLDRGTHAKYFDHIPKIIKNPNMLLAKVSFTEDENQYLQRILLIKSG